MPNYTVVIDAAQDPGITAAKNEHNAGLETDPDGTLPDSYIADNQGYVQFIMSGAAASYCQQYGITGAPVNSAAPALDKTTVVVGGRVTSNNGTWTGNPAPTSYAYQWQNNGVNIRLATTASYFATAAEVGGALRCRITANSPAGTKQAFSNTCTVTAATATAAKAVKK